jgi:uncharacterized integral membrane protein
MRSNDSLVPSSNKMTNMGLNFQHKDIVRCKMTTLVIHYGPSDEYQGYTTSRPSGAGDAVGGIGAVLLLAPFLLYDWISSYANHDFPGSVVAFFYYWSTIFPLSLPFRSYGAMTDPGMTPFTNLNFLLGTVAFVLVLAIVLLVFALIAQSAAEAKALSDLTCWYLLPGILYIIWNIVVGGISWVLASAYFVSWIF